MTTDTLKRPERPPSTIIEADRQTRQRLLRAAIDIFDRKGYAGASVREIVARAGVAKPALYYHFGSKEGVLAAVVAEGEHRFAEALARAAAYRGSTRERIIALAEDIYRLFQDNRAAVRVAHAIFLGPVEAAPSVDFTVFDRTFVQTLKSIVEDGIAAGEVVEADPLDVAIAMTGLIGACAGRQLHPGLEPLALDRVPRIVGRVLDGVLRTPQGDRRS